MHTARALRLRIAAERQSNVRVRREVRKVSALASMSKIGAVRSLTRLVAAWKRRSRDRPGFVHAEQRCTDAALVLDASTRVGAAAISGLIDLHLAFVVNHANGSINVLMLGLAKKLTLRVSRGSNTPSSYTQTHSSCQTHLRV